MRSTITAPRAPIEAAIATLPGHIASVAQELKRFADTRFGRHFLLIFGSYAYGNATEDSDLDTIAFTELPLGETYDELVNFYHDVCARRGVCLDGQYHHTDLLAMTYRDLERGIAGRGFEWRGNHLTVPMRVNSREFFRSDAWKWRFGFNILGSKTILISGDLLAYKAYRSQAARNLLGFVLLLNHPRALTVEDAVEFTIQDPASGRKEGMFLGYKDRPEVRGFLRSEYRRQIPVLTSLGRIINSPGGAMTASAEWINSLTDGKGCAEELGGSGLRKSQMDR